MEDEVVHHDPQTRLNQRFIDLTAAHEFIQIAMALSHPNPQELVRQMEDLRPHILPDVTEQERSGTLRAFDRILSVARAAAGQSTDG